MLSKEKINAIHELLIKDVITADEYVLILNALGKKEITVDAIKGDSCISLEYVIDVVCKYLNLDVEEVKSNARQPELVRGRQYIAYIARTITDATYKEIAETLGNRDHSTIMHGEKLIRDAINENEEIKNQIMAIENILCGEE